ncbi:MAG: NUDIX domain-containing protein [Myxococcota bacterium]
MSDNDVEKMNVEKAYDGFFRIDKYTLRHRESTGEMSSPRTWEVLERGDSAAILLHHVASDRVVLIKQFRAPAYARNPEDGWLTEVVAGIVKDEDGDPEACIRRETLEETGLEIVEIAPAGLIYPSPGGSSERIHLFYGTVEQDLDEGAKGLGTRNEDIWLVVLDADEFIRLADARTLHDAKTLALAYWFKNRRVYKLDGRQA